MRNEIWKTLIEFPNYKISNYGRVKSFANDKNGKILSQNLKSKYAYVQYRLNNKSRKAHILVLETFFGPRPPNQDACHNDGNSKNNHISNLRWDTRSNNVKDQVKHGTMTHGQNHGSSKLTNEQVLKMREMYKNGISGHKLQKMFGIGKSQTYYILNRKRWNHI